MGLVVIIVIYLIQFKRGQKIDQSISMSLYTLVFYIFAAVNSFTYFSQTTIQQFLAIVERVSSILKMEEFDFDQR